MKKIICKKEYDTATATLIKKYTYGFFGDPAGYEELLYQIDYQYFTIRELEKEVGAGKNQLRNRYNKAKKKQKLQKEADKNGDR